MSILSKPYFHDEAKAFEHVEAVLWPDGPICPHCGSVDRAYKLKGVRTKPSKKNPEGVERHGLWKCRDCRSQFTARIGTVFAESHLPLHKWLQAFHLVCASKKGVSAHQLHRILGVTYKTAWFLCHRIREAMRDDGSEPLGGPGRVVEADETFIGNKRRSRQRMVFKSGVGWTHRGGGSEQFKVISLVERGGRARSVHVPYLTANAARDVLARNVLRKSDLRTDESNIYKEIGREYESHETVNHSIREYARDLVHTNTIEGFFSIFKRGMRGVYQHCSEQHLHRYLAEFDFRYSNRSKLGVDDNARTLKALEGVKGKRLTYQGPVAPTLQ